MSDIAYWRDMYPEFNISDHPFRGQQESYQFSDGEADRLSRQIKKEGYFLSEKIIPEGEIEPLSRCITRIQEARALPLFIGVYDEFWQFLHKLRGTFTPIFGKSYRLPPDYWAFYVAPKATSRGWSVHRDTQISGPFDEHSHVHADGTPRMCTIWIPLTDATIHNSCIYALPFPHDPAMQSFLRKENMLTIQQQAQQTNWTNVRALPAPAGSVLGWTPYMLHWGSQSTDWATHARMSLGIYYEASDTVNNVGKPFGADKRTYVDLHNAEFSLSFTDRLQIVANIMATYIGNGQMVTEPCFSPAVVDFCNKWKHPSS